MRLRRLLRRRRLPENHRKSDTEIAKLAMGGGMSRANKFAIALVAIVVGGYFAWVQISCALDPHCHLNWCGKQPCGISFEKQNGGTQ
jgi:hypothetical protein